MSASTRSGLRSVRWSNGSNGCFANAFICNGQRPGGRRKHAAHCRRLAETARYATSHEHLLQMAEDLEEEATRLETGGEQRS